MRSRRGLTLLEMLGVLVMVTGAACLALPVLSATRVTGRELACADELRGEGRAVMRYAGDHGGAGAASVSPAVVAAEYEGVTFATPGFDRRAVLAGYVGPAGLAACPAVDAARPRDAGAAGAGGNAAALRGTVVHRVPLAMAATPPPSAVVVLQDALVDAAPDGGGAGQRYNHGTGREVPRRTDDPAFGGTWGGGGFVERGEGAPAGLNAWFADGHAQWVGAGEVGVTGWATSARKRRAYGPAADR